MQKSSDQMKRITRSNSVQSDDFMSKNIQSEKMNVNASGGFSTKQKSTNCLQTADDKMSVNSLPLTKRKRGRPKKRTDMFVLKEENSELENSKSVNIKEKSEIGEKERKNLSVLKTSNGSDVGFETRDLGQKGVATLKVMVKSKRGRSKKLEEISSLEDKDSDTERLKSLNPKEKSNIVEHEKKTYDPALTISESIDVGVKTRHLHQKDMISKVLKNYYKVKPKTVKKPSYLDVEYDTDPVSEFSNSDTENLKSLNPTEKSDYEENAKITDSSLTTSESIDVGFKTRKLHQKYVVKPKLLKKSSKGKTKNLFKISTHDNENSDTENLELLNPKEKSNIKEMKMVLKTSKNIKLGFKTRVSEQKDIVKSKVLKKSYKGKPKTVKKIPAYDDENSDTENLESVKPKEKSNIADKKIKSVLKTSDNLERKVKSKGLKKSMKLRTKIHKNTSCIELGNSKSGNINSLNISEETKIEETESKKDSVWNSESTEDLDKTIIYHYDSTYDSSPKQAPKDNTAIANAKSPSAKEPRNQSSEKRRLRLKICKICNRCYLKKKDVISHYVRAHENRLKKKCCVKKKSVYYKVSVTFVTKLPEEEHYVHCSVCDRRFSSPDFKKHCYSCIGPLYFSCTKCTWVFYSEEELRNHIYWDHEDHDIWRE